MPARAQGMTVEPDALEWIVERLGGDRGQTRGEIDKLLLYKGTDAGKTITLRTRWPCWATPRRSASTTSSPRRSMATSLASTGRSIVSSPRVAIDQLVRSLQRHADQLHLVSGHAAKGGNLEGAMFKARGLPRGGRCASVSNAICGHGRCRDLARRLSAILEPEIGCKQTGFPMEAIARRLQLGLSQALRFGESAALELTSA